MVTRRDLAEDWLNRAMLGCLIGGAVYLLGAFVFYSYAHGFENFRTTRVDFAFHYPIRPLYVLLGQSVLTLTFRRPIFYLVFAAVLCQFFGTGLAYSGPGDDLHRVMPLVNFTGPLWLILVVVNALACYGASQILWKTKLSPS